jgi:hypothetical protein
LIYYKEDGSVKEWLNLSPLNPKIPITIPIRILSIGD